MSAPKYSALGDLLCSCGEVMAGGIGPRGDCFFSCPKCNSSYIVGSEKKNPAPEVRGNMGMTVSPIYRYAFGEANWKVKDGHKE